jgi:tRNA(Ile2) C34 agmatinyltransferase TiaS
LKQQLIFIGLDDTDTLESRGTGHMARQIATSLASEYSVLGVIRHQLLIDPRVPYTAKNSSAAILMSGNGTANLDRLSARARAFVRDHFNPGSDPGLCVARTVPAAVTAFGRRVQREIVTQEEARALAAAHGIRLAGLGGTQAGVIGALAAVGLAADGDDGRYVMVGRARGLRGLHPVSAVLTAGVAEVQTLQGHRVTQGLILTDKLRPARRQGRPVAIVEWAEGYWRPLKLD